MLRSADVWLQVLTDVSRFLTASDSADKSTNSSATEDRDNDLILACADCCGGGLEAGVAVGLIWPSLVLVGHVCFTDRG